MKRKIIERICEILRDEIKQVIKDMKDVSSQDAEIYDYLESYMPYIDRDVIRDILIYNIHIMRDGKSITMYLTVEKELYIIHMDMDI